MKVTKRANGRIELILQAENKIEETFLAEMADRAVKGQSVSLEARGDAVVVSVEQ